MLAILSRDAMITAEKLRLPHQIEPLPVHSLPRPDPEKPTQKPTPDPEAWGRPKSFFRSACGPEKVSQGSGAPGVTRAILGFHWEWIG